MKKVITLIIIIIVMAFVLTACKMVSGLEIEKETPEQAISNIFSAIKDVNKEELTKYGAKELIGSTDELSNTRNKKIFETLEFEILSIEETEDSAIAKVELKTKDLTTVPQDYADKSAILTIENNNHGDNKLDNVVMAQKYSNLFVAVVDECEYTEFKEVVDVHLTKEGSNWKINIDNKFHNAIYGNMIMSQNRVMWPGNTKQKEEIVNNSENSVGKSITKRNISIIR